MAAGDQAGKDDDREIARRVLDLLADRRLLWKDFALEIEEHRIESANRVREQIGVHLDNPEIGPELARRLSYCKGCSRTSSTKSLPPGSRSLP